MCLRSLKGKILFERLFKEGKYFKNSCFSLRLLSNTLNILRLGISIRSNIFPKAVQRNRIKRLIKEALRRNKQNLNKGYDIIIRPKNFEVINLNYNDIEERLLDLFRTAGVILKKE